MLATISEKDANIALLELSPTVGSDVEVRKFKAEKDKLVNELKEQVNVVALLPWLRVSQRLGQSCGELHYGTVWRGFRPSLFRSVLQNNPIVQFVSAPTRSHTEPFFETGQPQVHLVTASFLLFLDRPPFRRAV